MLKINHLAVLAAVVLLHILGFLWFGALFGEKWMGMVGLDMATVEANPPGAGLWITNLVATVIPVYLLAWLFTKIPVESALKGALIGAAVGFGFILMADMAGNMFAQRPYGLAWITGGFSVVSLAIAGALLGGWRKYTSDGAARSADAM